MRRLLKAAAAGMCGLAALAGCGQGLIDGSYEGEGVNRVAGEVRSAALTSSFAGNVGVTVLWLPYWFGDGSGQGPGTGVGTAKPSPPSTGGPNGGPLCGLPTTPATYSDIVKVAISSSNAVMYGKTLPTSFVLPLTTPPPPEAMLDLGSRGGRGKAAIGTVIAFEDTNGNGKFDLGTPNTAAEPILAASVDISTQVESRQVLFLNGILPRNVPWPEQAQQGFNIVIQGPTRIATEANTTPINIDAKFGSAIAQEVDLCETHEYRSEIGNTPPPGVSFSCTKIESNNQIAHDYSWWGTDHAPCLTRYISGSRCFEPTETIPASFPPCP